MATYRMRGSAHNIIYLFRTEKGEVKQQWETYLTELEAMQRKTYIDYLQKSKQSVELLKAVMDYRKKRAIEKAVSEAFQLESVSAEPITDVEDNTNKTYRDFVEKWLPFHARKKRFSPNSYDSYRSNLDLHILPYFGDRIMSTITSEEIDDFIDYMSQKHCQGSKSYGKRRDKVPTLSSGTVKKCYTVLTSGLSTAKKWHYIHEIPEMTAPSEKTKKRKAWSPDKVLSILEAIKDDKLLHLAVHIGFVCSLRAGETAGIDVSTIGRPIEPSFLEKAFKDKQSEMGIAPESQIEYQGLRKSGQMHKVRLTQNNYQLLAENSGQSPEVLMSNYNEALDSEKRALSRMVEASFYPQTEAASMTTDSDMAAALQCIQQNPDLVRQLLQTMLLGAVHAQDGVQCAVP